MDFPTADFPTAEFSTALLRDLLDLTGSIGLADDELETRLAALLSGCRAAIPSYRGLQLTVMDGTQPVTLSAVDSTGAGQISTSLRLPFTALGPGFHRGSQAVFYAANPGAFVDLAADLGHTLQTPVITDGSGWPAGHLDGAGPRIIDGFDGNGPTGLHRRDGDASIILDADLPPTSLESGLAGLGHLSTINRAVGLLIDQGHHPDTALAVIHHHATKAGVEPHIYAAQLLGR